MTYSRRRRLGRTTSLLRQALLGMRSHVKGLANVTPAYDRYCSLLPCWREQYNHSARDWSKLPSGARLTQAEIHALFGLNHRQTLVFYISQEPSQRRYQHQRIQVVLGYLTRCVTHAADFAAATEDYMLQNDSPTSPMTRDARGKHVDQLRAELSRTRAETAETLQLLASLHLWIGETPEAHELILRAFAIISILRLDHLREEAELAAMNGQKTQTSAELV